MYVLNIHTRYESRRMLTQADSHVPTWEKKWEYDEDCMKWKSDTWLHWSCSGMLIN